MAQNPFSLENQVGLVTGAAQGLGQVFCHAFAEAGANIVAVDKKPTGRQTAREVEERGREALFLQADVSEQASVHTMVDHALARFGRIDFLMNNAGIAQHGAAENVTEEDWRKILDVNVTGLFFCCQAVGRHMIERRQGRIINIASMSGLIVNRPQAQAAYNTSKAAVIHLTRSLAVEWAHYNIRVNGIAPGYMETEMARAYLDKNLGVEDVWKAS